MGFLVYNNFMPTLTRQQKLDAINNWNVNKPSSDEDWAEDVKNESLHVKHDYQLEAMAKDHSQKFIDFSLRLSEIEKKPILLRWKVFRHYEQVFKMQAITIFLQNNPGIKPSETDILDNTPEKIEGKTIEEWVDSEVENELICLQWKVAKLKQSFERIQKELDLRKSGFLEVIKKEKKSEAFFKANTPEALTVRAEGSTLRAPIGTTYYVDPVNGNNANDGLGTGSGNAWLDLDQFTENARSAGDKVIIRRGGNRCDDGTDLNFTSDGTSVSPITIEADYDDAWSDFADSAQTYTATHGSKTLTASATITGISAGDWIYNLTDGDDPREFAYEVASVSGTTLTLQLPYKGSTGSGKTLKVMPDAPVWGATTTFAFQWNFDTDNYWKVQGVNFKTTDSLCIEIDSSIGHVFKDMIIEQGSGTSSNIQLTDDAGVLYVLKCRIAGGRGISPTGDAGGEVWAKDCLFTGGSGPTGMISGGVGRMFFDDCELGTGKDCIIWPVNGGGVRAYLRNPEMGSVTQFWDSLSTNLNGVIVQVEDYDRNKGDNRFINYFSTVETDGPLFQTDTGTVRSGGNAFSIKVTPLTSLGPDWEFSRIKIFDIPIYATTSPKTYDIYLRPTATTDWTADPTAAELWIEIEYWGHASNMLRKIVKSTGTIDMNGSTAWQALSLTVAPAQSGILYLRLWYAKTKESGKANTFYIDPLPVIT